MKQCESCHNFDCVLIAAQYKFTDQTGVHWAEKTYECFACGRAQVSTAPIARLPKGATERRIEQSPRRTKIRLPGPPAYSLDPLRILIRERLRSLSEKHLSEPGDDR